MLDQQTKTQFKQNFSQIKPQLKQRFPEVGEQELSTGQSDPDSLVATLMQRTGQPKEQIEQQFAQLVGSTRS